jgi:hypothetical protein
MLRALFFQARGVVDITAARDNESWGDNEQGGVFTRSFCGQLLRYADPRAARVSTWDGFFKVLQKETVTLFQGWARKADPRGTVVNVKRPPVPHKFVIDARASAGPDEPAGQARVVVSFQNKKTTAATYRWRWAGEQRWNTERLEPGGSKVHWRPVPASGEMPLLEVNLGGNFYKAQGNLFKGRGSPTFADGRKYYVRPAPKEGKGKKER